MIMQVVSKKEGFKYHSSYRKLGMTHLMFADDLIMFYKADPTSPYYIMDALKSFYDCVGLKINMEKSHKVLGGVNQIYSIGACR